MIDRYQKRAKRMRSEESLAGLSQLLGSTFNLRLARAFRSKMVLFVEGHDMKLLSIMAEKVGATRLAAEDGVTVIELGSFSQWPSAEAFSLLSSKFLGDAIKVRVLLDRDYRSDAQSAQVIKPSKALLRCAPTCGLERKLRVTLSTPTS